MTRDAGNAEGSVKGPSFYRTEQFGVVSSKIEAARMMPNKTPLSAQLIEAAERADELPREHIAKLLMKAAIRLRVIETAGSKLEHIPVYAYHLLRRISHAPVEVSTLFGKEDEAAVAFLLSRELVTRSADGRFLRITTAGEELGEIADERGED
jgi:hypothetical protein